MPKRPLAHEDNAEGQLNAGISAATTTIPLQSGDGAAFPTTYGGTATSGGTSTALNDTGIGASGFAVGDIIENITDGSYAVVLTINTNDIVTTPLVGGSDNTWQNGDVWAINRFVVTLVQYDDDGETVLKREKVLIRSRATDNLTVETSGRGYDGSSAQSFDSGDYVYQFTVAASFEGVYEVLADIMQTVETLDSRVDNKVSTTGVELHAVSATGNDAYVGVYSPVITSYTDGMLVSFEADVANTGNATFNGGGGAYNILKNKDQTLATGDIKAGQKVILQWDAGTTSWQMQSQIGNVPSTGTEYTYKSYTAGEDLGAGDLVAITAADTVKRVYMTGFGSPGTSTSTSSEAHGSERWKAIQISSTRWIILTKDSDGGGRVDAWTLIVDPDAGTITSLTMTVEVSTAMASVDYFDFDMIDSTKGVLVYGGGGLVRAKVLSGLDSGVTEGSEVIIETANSHRPRVQVYNTSHIIFTYIDEATVNNIVKCSQYSVSGTTLSAGTETNAYTTSSKNLRLHDFKQLGSSTTFVWFFKNVTDNIASCLVGTYNTGTAQFSSVGTETQFSGGDSGSAIGGYGSIGAYDSTHLILAWSDSTGLYFRTALVSGTTISYQAVVTSGLTITSNSEVSLTQWNARTWGVGCYTSGTSKGSVVEINRDLDSVVERATLTNSNDTLRKHGVFLQINPKKVCTVVWDDAASDTLKANMYTPTTNYDSYIGCMAAAVDVSIAGDVITSGYSDDFSGLTAGTPYYLDTGGLYVSSVNGTPRRAFVAKDATEAQIVNA